MYDLTTAETLVLDAIASSARYGKRTRVFPSKIWIEPQLRALASMGYLTWRRDGQGDFEVTASERICAVEPGDVRRLVLAPHCDDETLGCGGLLAKYPEQCAVVVVSRPDEVRKKEFEQAKDTLGYQTAVFLDMPDGNIAADMHDLVGVLDKVVAELKPLEMYLPFPSTHQDHIATYEAGVRAGRLSMSQGHHFTPSLYVYDVAAYDVNLYPTDLRWNVFESLTQEQIDRKVTALECYASQAITGPHPVNSVKQNAATTGHARQVEFAEQYAQIRAVRR